MIFDPEPVIAPADSAATTGSDTPIPSPSLLVSIGVPPSANCSPVPVSEVVKSPFGLTSNTRALPSFAKLNPAGNTSAMDTLELVPSGNCRVARIRVISPSVVSTVVGTVLPVGSNDVPLPAVLLDSPIIDRSGVTDGSVSVAVSTLLSRLPPGPWSCGPPTFGRNPFSPIGSLLASSICAPITTLVLAVAPPALV